MKTDGNTPRYSADGKSSVLIYGLDKDVRFLLRTILDLWEYDPEEAESVEDALRIASQKSIDLVLMDMKLEFPESFMEMRRMKKIDLFRFSPFILLSGHVQSDVRLSAIAAGAADFFIKPINLDLLEQKIKIHIAELNRLKEIS